MPLAERIAAVDALSQAGDARLDLRRDDYWVASPAGPTKRDRFAWASLIQPVPLSVLSRRQASGITVVRGERLFVAT